MVYLSNEAVETLDECVRLFEEFTSIKTNYSQAVTTLFKLSSDIKAFQRVKDAEKALSDFELLHPEMRDEQPITSDDIKNAAYQEKSIS